MTRISRSENSHGLLCDTAAFLCGELLETGVLAESYTARVMGIADGDTVTVLDASVGRHKVRLEGFHAREKAPPFGNLLRQLLAKLVFGELVTVMSRYLYILARLDFVNVNLDGLSLLGHPSQRGAIKVLVHQLDCHCLKQPRLHHVGHLEIPPTSTESAL